MKLLIRVLLFFTYFRKPYTDIDITFVIHFKGITSHTQSFPLYNRPSNILTYYYIPYITPRLYLRLLLPLKL